MQIRLPDILLASLASVFALSAQPARARVSHDLPRVVIDAGALEGTVDSSGLLVFKGIPYAAPPVGSLRWRAPRPVAHWKGVRPAKALGHNCMQLQPYSDIDPFAAGTSEDCLYLNVTTPSTLGRQPVMVWIHGGGFFAGFGGEERHNGSVLAHKGVVVVTLNYRLGPFGFFAHPALSRETSGHASGNYGLLDQIAALEWVKRNIARFGGDPSRVTIFGESAGGMSVGVLIGSPLAKGLFRGAILESGTGFGPFISRSDSAEAASGRIAAALGIKGDDEAALSRLRAVTADSILAATTRVAGSVQQPILWPTIDGNLLRQPVDSAILRGQANIVPIIVGSNADEPQAMFGAPSRALARLITSRGTPAWLYQFTRVGDDSVNRARGAYHSAEITFVFGRSKPLLESAGHTSYDARLAEAMSDYWVAFATSLNPNGPPARGKWPAWPAYDRASEGYMELGPQIVAKQHLRQALYDSLDVIARAHGEVRQ